MSTDDNLVINFAGLNPEDIKVFNTEKQLYHNFLGYRIKRVFTSSSEEVPAFYVAYKENKSDSPYAVCMLSAYVTMIDSMKLVEEVGEWTPDGEQPEPPAPVTKYTITVVSNNESMGTVSGGGEYYEGSQVELIATPSSDSYVFSSWNDENTDNPRTVVVSGDATYTANFISTIEQ